ncbi:MAG: hypothetical protein KDH19_05690 [Geminicoccaceae bacterium]|nr:hypothetical protein [Geminicoccaceae bacterium]
MYICLCNALKEQACHEAAAQPGTRNAGCVYRRLGCRVRCGACVSTMQEIVEHVQGNPKPVPQPAEAEAED